MDSIHSGFITAPAGFGRRCAAAALLAAMLAAGCGSYGLPSAGPRHEDIETRLRATPRPAVHLVETDEVVARRLQERQRPVLFSDLIGPESPMPAVLGPGDGLEIHVFESPPATLFGGAPVDPRAPSTARATVLPEQVVDAEGLVSVPFAGRVPVAGLTRPQVEAEIARRLRGKANQPEVVVRQTRNVSAAVTVVGEVAQSQRMPLTAGRERLLDALAAAGGVRQPVHKMSLQLTRGRDFHALPLDLIIRDPRQNVLLRPGDVVTALHQPMSFTALGATGRNEEVPFEAQGIHLAQALARAGGLLDNRSSPQGVFVFRFEALETLDPAPQGISTGPDGRIPVVYRVDLTQPQGFFVLRTFPVLSQDIVFVSNAPAADLQKFLNLVFSVVYPLVNVVNATR